MKLGKEGQLIERGMHKGKGIAVFTSGGDSQVSAAAEDRHAVQNYISMKTLT